MKVLILGGLGFIGRAVVSRLNLEHEITIVDVRAPARGEVPPEVKVKTGNVIDVDFLHQIMREGFPVVVHLVGLPSVRECECKRFTSYRLNYLSTARVLEAMKVSGIRKLVFASTALVYGLRKSMKPISEDETPRPRTLYGQHKFLSEELIREYARRGEVEAVILRLFNVYGRSPKEAKDVLSIWLRNSLQGKPILVRIGDFRDFIHVRDVAEIILRTLALDLSEERLLILNVGSGKALRMEEVADLFLKHFPDLEIYYEEGQGLGLRADISKVQQILHFKPICPEKGIKMYITEFLGRMGHETRIRC